MSSAAKHRRTPTQILFHALTQIAIAVFIGRRSEAQVSEDLATLSSGVPGMGALLLRLFSRQDQKAEVACLKHGSGLDSATSVRLSKGEIAQQATPTRFSESRVYCLVVFLCLYIAR